MSARAVADSDRQMLRPPRGGGVPCGGPQRRGGCRHGDEGGARPMSARAVADSDRQMLRPPFRVLTLLLAASMAAAGLVAIAPVSAAATSAPPAGAVSSTGLC